MKYIVVIGDGMADNPVPELENKTPLEVANKPQIDKLSQEGQLGTVRTVPTGMAPGSDTAILSIFGYDPQVYFSGRSPLEAAGSGIALEDGDVSYRCNMVALEDADVPYAQKKILSHSGGSVDGACSMALMRDLLAQEDFAACAQKHGMQFHLTPSFRHIAVQKNADIQGLVAIPPHDHLGEVLDPLQPTGAPVAEGLAEMMQKAHAFLNHHSLNEERRRAGKLPANSIWFWAEGRAIALPAFAEKYQKRGFVVSAVPLVHGIGRLAGLEVLGVPGATAELDTDFEGKAQKMLEGLAQGYDFGLMHVEAPDECTHNGDTGGKIQAIEWLDSRSLAPLVQGLREQGEDFRLLIISDHKTLTDTRGHDGDPVPFILYDSRGGEKSGLAYTEENAQRGEFIPAGSQLMSRLFEV